jgi:uncharacterized membrane protein
MSESRHRTVVGIVAALTALWCAGIVAAPLLRHAGIGASALLYAFFGRVCHQLGARSWHLDGEPLGVCVRCASIYGAFALSLLVLLARPSRWTRLPSFLPLGVVLAAMALDALLNIAGIMASTELHRLVTGAAVGALLPWYVIPLLLEAIDGVRRRSASSVAQGESVHVRETE